MTATGHAQHTLRESVTLSGVGVHSGAPVTVVCRPAPAGTGITLARADLPAARPVAARVASVTDSTRGVTLGGSNGVRTVEHLLAAAWGVGITNLHVDVDGAELPALDGSAAPFCLAFEDAGLAEQDGVLDPLAPAEPVWVQRASAWVLALPAERFRATYIVPLSSAALGIQVIDVEMDRRRFVREFAPARTWGFVEELQALRAAGLARGASEENALGIGPQGYIGTPRFVDEPARHKVLDLIGDLSLLGRPLQAHVIAFAAGHALHIELARAIEKSWS